MRAIDYPVTAKEIGTRLFDDLNNYHHHQLQHGQPLNPIPIPWSAFKNAIDKARKQLAKPTVGSQPIDLTGIEIRLVFSDRELVPHHG